MATARIGQMGPSAPAGPWNTRRGGGGDAGCPEKVGLQFLVEIGGNGLASS
jgi:hypothetical protein